ncbi:MAG TPA: spore germination protein GerW family protein, partial [Candidatus Eisenbacteria bacterium]|nr:spore germination protein GerW family protein [Candidatus Eisenbacteria bacterium]
ALTVRRVYGDPIERDGLVLVPAAAVRGGAGGGGGEAQPAEGAQPGSGFGGGWGGSARPVGAFVITGGSVSWQPAVDVNRVILGGQAIAVIALLVVGSIVRSRRRHRR